MKDLPVTTLNAHCVIWKYRNKRLKCLYLIQILSIIDLKISFSMIVIYSCCSLNKVVGKLMANTMILKILLLISYIRDADTAAVTLVVFVSPRESDAFVRLVKGKMGSSYIRENMLDAALARLRAWYQS